jgi:MFS family permease
MSEHMTPQAAVAPRPRLLTGPLMMLCLSNFCALTSFYLLLTVVPMYAEAAGGGGTGAGMATGALMLTTVAAELFTPWLMARYGYRLVLVAGLVLLGAPALVLPGSGGMVMILVVCLVRGIGFAIAMVAGGALTASLLPADRRGEGLGLLGVVNGIPAVLGLPVGVWLAECYGYAPVFVLGALAGLAAAALVPKMSDPTSATRSQAGQPLGVLAGLRLGALVRPSILFCSTAMTAGVVVTFLPAAATHASAGLATGGLLVHSVVATLARVWAGRYGDRHGAAGLLVPSVLVTAAGMLLMVMVASPAAVIAGMVLGGAGFGVAQNASLVLLYRRVPVSGYGAVNAIWSVAYDAGLGVGGAGFGVLAAQTGYPAAFALTALLLPAVLLLARATTPRPGARPTPSGASGGCSCRSRTPRSRHTTERRTYRRAADGEPGGGRWSAHSRSAMVAMPLRMARWLRLPKPRTSCGGVVARVERYVLMPYSPTERARAAVMTACSSADSGRCATAWKPAARPVTQTWGALAASASTSAARRLA